jgi:CubicO group peptidase (beta-lactamase class C family)
MKRLLLPVIAALLTAATAAAASADPIDDFISGSMRQHNVPGLSLAVVSQGRIVRAEGYGLADRDVKIQATPETAYKIGSVSKPFTAAAILRLARDGRLRLDDRITTYLAGAPRSWRSITIRHLLTHTSGLVRESPAFSPFVDRPAGDLVEALHSVPLRFAPGTQWEYSNAGYVVLAEIIRIVSDRPWTEYLDRQIFTPAGMAATVLTTTTTPVPNRAMGYTGDDNRRKADEWAALRASGAHLSTVLDLAKWDVLLDTDTILGALARREMWTPVRLIDGKTAAYGLGWHVDTGRYGRRVWHGGELPGFTAHFVRFLDKELSVIVLANGDDADIGAIANGVASLYLGAGR